MTGGFWKTRVTASVAPKKENDSRLPSINMLGCELLVSVRVTSKLSGDYIFERKH